MCAYPGSYCLAHSPSHWRLNQGLPAPSAKGVVRAGKALAVADSLQSRPGFLPFVANLSPADFVIHLQSIAVGTLPNQMKTAKGCRENEIMAESIKAFSHFLVALKMSADGARRFNEPTKAKELTLLHILYIVYIYSMSTFVQHQEVSLQRGRRLATWDEHHNF